MHIIIVFLGGIAQTCEHVSNKDKKKGELTEEGDKNVAKAVNNGANLCQTTAYYR